MLPEIRLPSLQGLGDRWEQQVRERFGREQNTYVPPDSFEASQGKTLVSDLSKAVKARDLQGVEKLSDKAQSLGLSISQLNTDKDRFILLEESEPKKGWGHILFRVQDPQPGPSLVMEVPHPSFDGGTPELAMEMFSNSRADVLLMAGAHRLNRPEPSVEQPHRRLADPSHSSATFFHAAHEGLQGPGQTVLQIHGFSPRTPADPQVVLSDGQDDNYDPPALLNLSHNLQAQGLTTGVVDFSEDWLTARTNLQGQAMARENLLGPQGPSQFVHVEFDVSLRKGPERQQGFDKVVRAIEDWNLTS